MQQHRWVEFAGSDPGAKDIARVLRVPGTRNMKPKYAPDYPLVEFVRYNANQLYTVQQLISYMPLPKHEPQPQQRRAVSPNDEGERVLRVAELMVARSADGYKHTELLKAARLVGGAIASGFLAEIEAVNALESAIRAKPGVKNMDGAIKTIRDGIDYGKAAPLNS